MVETDACGNRNCHETLSKVLDYPVLFLVNFLYEARNEQSNEGFVTRTTPIQVCFYKGKKRITVFNFYSIHVLIF